MNDPYQKAAKLLIVLDPSAARKLLYNLNEDEKDNISYWIDQIETVSSEEAHQLVESFYTFYQENDSGHVHNNHLIEKIERGDLQMIERMMRKETPRTIAMLLPFLSLKTTSKLLAQMNNELLGAVISEAAKLEPQQIEKAKATLEKNWGDLALFHPTYGLDLIEGWYLSLEEGKQQDLLDILHQMDPELESQLIPLHRMAALSSIANGNSKGSY